MIDLAGLEAKAKAATPEWKQSGATRICSDHAGGIIAGFLKGADAEFAAAANPDAVLALIRELSEARGAIAAEREACASLCDMVAFSYPNAERCAALIRARGEKGGA